MIVKFFLQWYFFFICITKSHHREMIHQNRKVISAESHQCRNMPYIRKDPIYFSFREYISIPIILTKIFYGLVLLLIDLLLIWLSIIFRGRYKKICFHWKYFYFTVVFMINRSKRFRNAVLFIALLHLPKLSGLNFDEYFSKRITHQFFTVIPGIPLSLWHRPFFAGYKLLKYCHYQYNPVVTVISVWWQSKDCINDYTNDSDT